LATRARDLIPPEPSPQSDRLAGLLRERVRPMADRGVPHGMSLAMTRAAFAAAGQGRLPRGTQVWQARYGSVRGLWVRAPKASAANGAILHLHGGGFVFGSSRSHRALAFSLSKATGCPVFLPDYRRAPEHPFPAAADDVLITYRELVRRGFDPARITVSGDSAGGHLAAGLLADLARCGDRLPANLVLLSPWLDLTISEATDRDRRSRDPYVAPSYLKRARWAYVGRAPLTDPRLAPLESDFSGWPPVLIQVGGTECLLGDSERLAAALVAAGVPCELQVWPGQVHVFQAFASAVPEGRAALRYLGEFVRRPLAPRPVPEPSE
jgi:acetyl esterase/lipase